MGNFTVKRDSGLFIGDIDIAPASGTIDITKNGTDIDVARYAKANVNVPQPSGKINITENGTDIDISEYALADVDVPALTTKFEASTFPSYRINYCEPVADELYVLEIPTDVEYTQLGNMCCFANSNVKTVIIDVNITSIVNGECQDQYSENDVAKTSAFGYCKNLTDVLGGINIDYVGNLSFVGCDNLRNMSYSFENGSLKTIGDYAFYGCSMLEGNIKFNALKEIGVGAFKGTQLDKIYIIGTDTFNGNAKICSQAFYRLRNSGTCYEKIILNTNGGSTLDIEDLAFSGDSGTNVNVLAI